MKFNIIGTIYKPTGNMLTDEEGLDYPEQAPIEGYHVNSSVQVPELEAYRIEPVTPMRVYAGCVTYFYRFANEAEFNQLASGL